MRWRSNNCCLSWDTRAVRVRGWKHTDDCRTFAAEMAGMSFSQRQTYLHPRELWCAHVERDGPSQWSGPSGCHSSAVQPAKRVLAGFTTSATNDPSRDHSSRMKLTSTWMRNFGSHPAFRYVLRGCQRSTARAHHSRSAVRLAARSIGHAAAAAAETVPSTLWRDKSSHQLFSMPRSTSTAGRASSFLFSRLSKKSRSGPVDDRGSAMLSNNSSAKLAD